MADVGLTTLLWAIVGGVIPTFLWMWFWFSQTKKPESTGFLSLLYIIGMVCVFIVFPIDHWIMTTQLNQKEHLLAFAGVEEIVKLLITALIAFGGNRTKKPTDYTLFLVTTALGFSALENTLYLIDPITQNNITSILFASNLRFIGATLLHTVCVAIVGIMLGVAFYENVFMKWVHGLFGLGLAIGLHGVFNYFIMINTTRSIMIGLAGLWFIGLIVIVIFGRIQKIGVYNKLSEESLAEITPSVIS
jgi:RsiW-degrading membrane proteinase PrsW (M82 family)